MRGAVLWAALCLFPLPAGAQGLEGEVIELLRTRDCVMAADALAEVFVVMGRSADEIGRAVDALVAGGRAQLLAGQLRLSPEACRPPLPPRVPPMPWIEERLAGAPGCRRVLAELAAEAEGEGVAPHAFDRVVEALTALGRVAAEDGEVRLRPDLCGPESGTDRGLDRVLSLGLDSYRAVIGLLAIERDCRLDLADREALLRDLSLLAGEMLFLAAELSPDATLALSRRLDEALEDPGPAYRIEEGELVAIYCMS